MRRVKAKRIAKAAFELVKFQRPIRGFANGQRFNKLRQAKKFILRSTQDA